MMHGTINVKYVFAMLGGSISLEGGAGVGGARGYDDEVEW